MRRDRQEAGSAAVEVAGQGALQPAEIENVNEGIHVAHGNPADRRCDS